LTNGFVVFHEEENQYVRAEVGSDGDMSVTAVYPKEEYGNYRTFWNIMGKFDPYTKFLVDPVEIEDLSFEKVSTLYDKLAEKFGWGQNQA
jgi:hypothetical protein